MSGWTWLESPLGVHLVVAIAALYPLARIFRRAGLPIWPAFTIAIPLVGFAVAASVLAFKPWPAVRPRRPAKAGGG